MSSLTRWAQEGTVFGVPPAFRLVTAPASVPMFSGIDTWDRRREG